MRGLSVQIHQSRIVIRGFFIYGVLWVDITGCLL